MSARQEVGTVRVRHPAVGSVYLHHAYVLDGYVIGEAWDDSQRGSPFLPDDYMGEPVTLNFPVGCIMPPKVERFADWARDAAFDLECAQGMHMADWNR